MAYLVAIVISIGIFAIVAVAYDLIFGHTGLFSAAQIALYATGAYVSARVLTDVTNQFLVGALAGALAATVVGWLIGRVTLHLLGDYFVVGTLGLHALVIAVVTNWTSGTGGSAGLFGIPRPTFADQVIVSNNAMLGLVLVTLVVVTLLSWRVVGSPFGRLLHAVRDDALALTSLGYDTARIRRAIFALSAGLAGLAGALYASYVQYIDPSSFTLDPLILVLAMVVVGGLGTVIGPLLGALVVISVPEALRYVELGRPENLGFVQNAIFGGLLVAIVLLRPKGLLPEALVERWRRPRLQPRVGRAGEVLPLRTTKGPSVEVADVVKTFGGIRALDHVDLTFRERAITSVIGPNGAGKSTLLSCIAATYAPDEGVIKVAGRTTKGLAPHRLLARGIARTFQDPHLFGTMTVLENVELGHKRRHGRTLTSALLRPFAVAREQAEIRRSALALLDWIGLREMGDRPAAELSGGQQKLVSLARTLATEADVILLDEPTAGVAPTLVPELVARIKDLKEAGHTVCVIEHRVEVVRELSDWVFVMDAGKVVLAGEPEDVLAREELEELYLGRPHLERVREEAR